MQTVDARSISVQKPTSSPGPDDLTKVSFCAVPRALKALHPQNLPEGLNTTETINRAVQVYAGLTRLSLWTAIRIVIAERAELRRIAAADRKSR